MLHAIDMNILVSVSASYKPTKSGMDCLFKLTPGNGIIKAVKIAAIRVDFLAVDL